MDAGFPCRKKQGNLSGMLELFVPIADMQLLSIEHVCMRQSYTLQASEGEHVPIDCSPQVVVHGGMTFPIFRQYR